MTVVCYSSFALLFNFERCDVLVYLHFFRDEFRLFNEFKWCLSCYRLLGRLHRKYELWLVLIGLSCCDVSGGLNSNRLGWFIQHEGLDLTSWSLRLSFALDDAWNLTWLIRGQTREDVRLNNCISSHRSYAVFRTVQLVQWKDTLHIGHVNMQRQWKFLFGRCRSKLRSSLLLLSYVRQCTVSFLIKLRHSKCFNLVNKRVMQSWAYYLLLSLTCPCT